jgi:hypothetical protein
MTRAKNPAECGDFFHARGDGEMAAPNHAGCAKRIITDIFLSETSRIRSDMDTESPPAETCVLRSAFELLRKLNLERFDV